MHGVCNNGDDPFNRVAPIIELNVGRGLVPCKVGSGWVGWRRSLQKFV